MIQKLRKKVVGLTVLFVAVLLAAVLLSLFFSARNTIAQRSTEQLLAALQFGVEQAETPCFIAEVLPSGPVVQYLRENEPLFDYKNGGLSLNRDGFHLSWDYGRYAAAATWYKVLTGNVPAVNAFPDWDATLIDAIHAGIEAVVGE